MIRVAAGLDHQPGVPNVASSLRVVGGDSEKIAKFFGDANDKTALQEWCEENETWVHYLDSHNTGERPPIDFFDEELGVHIYGDKYTGFMTTLLYLIDMVYEPAGAIVQGKLIYQMDDDVFAFAEFDDEGDCTMGSIHVSHLLHCWLDK